MNALLEDAGHVWGSRASICLAIVLFVGAVAAWAANLTSALDLLESLPFVWLHTLLCLSGTLIGLVALWRGWFGPKRSYSRLLAIAGWFGLVLCLVITFLGALSSGSQIEHGRSACRVRLHKIASVLTDLVKEKGRFPAATNWCDTLRDLGGMGENFNRCPFGRERSLGYAFNAALGLKKPNEVASNCVMLVESEVGWNIAGGPETFHPHGHSWRFARVAFADGKVRKVPINEVKNLRWTP